MARSPNAASSSASPSSSATAHSRRALGFLPLAGRRLRAVRNLPGSPMRLVRFLLCLALLVAATPLRAEQVGGLANDWTGNGFVIDAVTDPKVQGITCHLVYFDRSVLDRLA